MGRDAPASYLAKAVSFIIVPPPKVRANEVLSVINSTIHFFADTGFAYLAYAHNLSVMKWVIVFLAVLNFGYMAFDGTRALVTGSYITPSSGEYKGRLGPWSKVVSAIGIEPESTLMKALFVIWGVAGLVVTVLFLKDPARYKSVLLVANLCSLWYAFAGTTSSLIQLILLWLLKV